MSDSVEKKYEEETINEEELSFYKKSDTIANGPIWNEIFSIFPSENILDDYAIHKEEEKAIRDAKPFGDKNFTAQYDKDTNTLYINGKSEKKEGSIFTLDDFSDALRKVDESVSWRSGAYAVNVERVVFGDKIELVSGWRISNFRTVFPNAKRVVFKIPSMYGVSSGFFSDDRDLKEVSFSENLEVLNHNLFTHSGLEILKVKNIKQLYLSSITRCSTLKEVHFNSVSNLILDNDSVIFRINKEQQIYINDTYKNIFKNVLFQKNYSVKDEKLTGDLEAVRREWGKFENNDGSLVDIVDTYKAKLEELTNNVIVSEKDLNDITNKIDNYINNEITAPEDKFNISWLDETNINTAKKVIEKFMEKYNEPNLDDLEQNMKITFVKHNLIEKDRKINSEKYIKKNDKKTKMDAKEFAEFSELGTLLAEIKNETKTTSTEKENESR